MTGTVMVLLAVVGVLALARRWIDRRRIATAERERADAAPEVIELLAVALASGAGVERSLAVVVLAGPPSVALVAARVGDRLDAGLPLSTAVRRFTDDLGPDYRSVGAALEAAVTDGVPIAQVLLRLGDDARAARRRRDERRARAASVGVLAPLVCCSLPAVVVVAVVPLLVVSLGRLSP